MSAVYTPPKAEQNAAIASLQCSGKLPEDAYWKMVAARHDLNPTRFDHYHPQLAFLMDRNERQEKGQEGCNTAIVSQHLLKEYEKNHAAFTKHHGGWLTKLVKADLYLMQHPADCQCGCATPIVPVCPPLPHTESVPEPTAITMLGVGLAMVWLRQRMRR